MVITAVPVFMFPSVSRIREVSGSQVWIFRPGSAKLLENIIFLPKKMPLNSREVWSEMLFPDFRSQIRIFRSQIRIFWSPISDPDSGSMGKKAWIVDPCSATLALVYILYMGGPMWIVGLQHEWLKVVIKKPGGMRDSSELWIGIVLMPMQIRIGLFLVPVQIRIRILREVLHFFEYQKFFLLLIHSNASLLCWNFLGKI